MSLLRKSTLTSLLFIGVGGVFAVIAWLHHPLGTPSSMGRGFFPSWVGLILAALGTIMLLAAPKREGPDEEAIVIALRPLVTIIASVVAFGLTLPSLGLYAATLLSVLIASRADPAFRLGAATALGLALALAGHAVFIAGLGLPVPAWPGILSN
ncbi:tripartite tricarboxylate transporter TctB family protein [Marinivivus vitaminiproducens]|uniref:tripartite tricarboxylate transporter TctB family protein n=1 Tax=Marinivivus vitaminiproducens TaxID=3035935 RepID=UPI00279D1311|nr:tripartite tricarboxylate transporter TctB family protein [Geminicoccaceae bacterium SCSIO 64248]